MQATLKFITVQCDMFHFVSEKYPWLRRTSVIKAESGNFVAALSMTANVWRISPALRS